MKPSLRSVVVYPLLALAMAGATSANASWPSDGLFINALPPTTTVVTDGAGGIFMSWPQAFGTTIQRISPTGELLLGTDGVSISLIITSPTDCFSDGAGGLYVAGHFNSYIRLLRLDAQGNILWNKDVVQTLGAKAYLHASPDGTGGALLAWSEIRDLPVPQNAFSAYCQRVNANGDALWTANGVRVTYSAWSPPHSGSDTGRAVNVLDVFPVGDGGAFVNTTYYEYYGDKDPVTVYQLPPAGTTAAAVVGSPNYGLGVIPDGDGGLYATYYDGADLWLAREKLGVGSHFDMVLSSFGSPSLLSQQPTFALIPDGVLVVWGRDWDVYAQKVDDSGTELWTPGGVPVCQVYGNQDDIVVGSDFHGGAHVFWSDARYGQRDLYRQHIDSNGNTLLGVDYGEPFTSQEGDEIRTALYMDPAGYGIVTWNSAQFNYAQRFDDMSVAAAISSFRVDARNGAVSLTAEYRSNLAVQKVNVYRGRGEGQLQGIATVPGDDENRFVYLDRSVSPNTTYRYQVGIVDGDGEFLSPVETVSTPRIQSALEQNSPNPFNPETHIRFVLAEPSRASIHIYTPGGAHVRALYDRMATAGPTSVLWDGTDDHGQPVATGLYLYRLTAGKFEQTRKMILLK